MKKILRSPLFWVSATLLAGFLYFFSFHFFYKTFPLVNLSITMNLEHALVEAKKIAQDYQLGPIDYQSAAVFFTDETTKTFIELEAGGKDALVSMMHQKLYMPYTWQVRHFKEFEKNEVLIKFTPDGVPYGFIETISENIPGAQLSEIEAQNIAEKYASSAWNINFAEYKKVETSQKTQPSNRIDHTFVYERINHTIGEGFYRLKIYVSGDKITEITHFVKIPETFQRRYMEMRSANNSIAWAAVLLIGILYILGGCGLGMFFIFKNKWEIWKHAIIWSIILAITQTLTQINQLPSLWMYYNSAIESNSFLVQLFIGFFYTFIAQAGACSFLIITAESLTRKAFGNHPQLWSLWMSGNAASYTVLGRTYGAYLIVSALCAFIIGFYAFSTRYLGWWIPSDTLFNPNILATYAPWFSPFALSLNAGFMEECLFRAIPLASAALLGQHFGKRNLWIIIALIAQAFIFGAAHANYPTQPAYGRLIELLIPSIIFGITYLRFGLLPSILTHIMYDFIWFSIPIFVSTALLSKIIIIILGLLPLCIIFYARIRQGKWHHFEEHYRNKNWQPKEIIEKEKQTITISHKEMSSQTKIVLSIITIISIIMWIYATPFKHDGVTITETKQNIRATAHSFLKSKNIELSPAWYTLPLFFNDYSQIPALSSQHLFIWREGKKDVYHKLLNTYLQPAHWIMRYAQFEGDLIQRAEEHTLMFYDNLRYFHKLPESLEGASLTKEQARPIAHKILIERYAINPSDVTEISAEETQLPHRKNWFFTFLDPLYPLEKGQARINIVISGDEVIDAARIIHVPETWEREDLNNRQKLGIINLIITLLLSFLFIMSLVLAHKQHLSYAVSPRLWGFLCILLINLFVIDVINSYPSIIGLFNTSEPWNNQLFQRFGGLLFVLFLKTLVLSLVIAYSAQHIKFYNKSISFLTLFTGYGVGIIIAAMVSLGQKIMPSMQPLWPNYVPLSTAIPLVGSLIQNLIGYISTTASYLFLYIIINQATQYWHTNKLFFSIFFIAYGFLLVPLQSFTALPLWIGIGLIAGIILLLLYIFIIRFNSTIIPLMIASMFILQNIQQGIFNAYPGALLAAIINICIIFCISMIWFKKLQQK